jgi:transposase
MEIQKPSRRRRYHPEEFKKAVIEACCEPGVSVAGIAMSQRGQREPSPALDA